MRKLILSFCLVVLCAFFSNAQTSITVGEETWTFDENVELPAEGETIYLQGATALSYNYEFDIILNCGDKWWWGSVKGNLFLDWNAFCNDLLDWLNKPVS